MKFRFRVLILLFATVFLVGCKKQLEQEVIEEKMILFIDKSLDINLPASMNVDMVNWQYSNPDVLYFETTTRIVGFDEGICVIKAKDGKVEYILTVEIFDESKVNKEINGLIDILREEVKIENDELKLVYTLDSYDFTINYVSTKPEILSIDGEFTRTLLDQYVNLKATLVYKGVTRNVIIPVKIDMIPYNEQQNVIKKFLDDNIQDIIDVEEGQLPTYLEVYDLEIDWFSSYPGIVDSNNTLHKAYEETDVSLYALYKIGGKDESMEIKYRSKGINESEKPEYINKILKDLIPSEAGKWLSIIFDQDLTIIKDFVYPDSVTRLRPGTGKKGVEMPGGPQYVVIHDTGMTGPGDNADGVNDFIHYNANNVDGRVASWHFSIDQEKIYQHVPTNEIAWHAGDGSTQFGSKYINLTSKRECIGGGNQNGIAIETCINPGNDYELTLKRTAKLTASLLHQYGLGLDRIKQHFDFSGKICPNVIRSTFGMWESFLKDVEIAYFLMMIDKDYKVSWEISHPEVIKKSGVVNTPIDDTLVDLKLTLTLNGEVNTYDYKTNVKGLPVDVKLSNVFYDLYLSQIPRVINTDIKLPVINDVYNAQITWASSREDILSSEGRYVKPDKSEDVTLTAKITIKGKELIRTITVTVE